MRQFSFDLFSSFSKKVVSIDYHLMRLCRQYYRGKKSILVCKQRRHRYAAAGHSSIIIIIIGIKKSE